MKHRERLPLKSISFALQSQREKKEMLSLCKELSSGFAFVNKDTCGKYKEGVMGTETPGYNTSLHGYSSRRTLNNPARSKLSSINCAW